MRSLASRAPYPVWALAACALFLMAGLAVLDDYGVSADEPNQRSIAAANLNYILGDRNALPEDHNRFYGVAFEMPLLWVERVLGLEDTRSIYLTRHILTHLFFLTGGLFCSLLAYRLFNSRLLALFALLLFLLHPRIYTHSFFNSKDVPFLSMFMVALYLTHRAFRRDTVWAFALCGVAVGLLTNLRVMGVMLFPAVLGMRLLDLYYAAGREERKRILLTGGVFLLAGAITLYAVSPYLWSNPLRFLEALSVLSQHPYDSPQLFQGERIPIPELPWRYIPTWIAITTPPFALLLGLIGTVAVCYRGTTRPGDILRKATLRFEVLLIGCLVLPFLAVVILDPNIHDGWRQMYFLWAPFCLLAVFGLHWLASVFKRASMRLVIYGLAAVGVAFVVVEMSQIHPHQHVYFNLLVDRTTPGYLSSHYYMDYMGTLHREALEHLLAKYPSSEIYANCCHADRNRSILPESDRNRIFVKGIDGDRVDFQIINDRDHTTSAQREPDLYAPVVYTRRIYNTDVLTVYGINSSMWDDATMERVREEYRSVVLGEPVIREAFDVYFRGNALYYVKEPCFPADVQTNFLLNLIPVDAQDLPDDRKEHGFDNLDFSFERRGVTFDGGCMAKRLLPEYPIDSIETGQFVREGEGYRNIWRGEFRVEDQAPVVNVVERFRGEYRSVVSGEPAFRSTFDVYLKGNSLYYVKEPCSPDDVQARIFLYLNPVDAQDLPERRREEESDNLDFSFHMHGIPFDGRCMAKRLLPEYPIDSIETGQFVQEGEGYKNIWRGEFQVEEYAALERLRGGYRSVVSGGPAIRSTFDVYLRGNSLYYVKEPCSPDDVRASFFLHVNSVDAQDLPDDRRQHGFENLDFTFDQYGVMFDGKCMVGRDLPEYPIAGISTGQFEPDGEDYNNIWLGQRVFRVARDAEAEGVRKEYESVAAGEPIIRSTFEVYFSENTFYYVKEPCSLADVLGYFSLHLSPVDVQDLPDDRRQYGFDNLDFRFDDLGMMFDGGCMAKRDLPEYPIDSIRTGQYLPNEKGYSSIWYSEFRVEDAAMERFQEE